MKNGWKVLLVLARPRTALCNGFLAADQPGSGLGLPVLITLVSTVTHVVLYCADSELNRFHYFPVDHHQHHLPSLCFITSSVVNHWVPPVDGPVWHWPASRHLPVLEDTSWQAIAQNSSAVHPPEQSHVIPCKIIRCKSLNRKVSRLDFINNFFFLFM